MRILHTSDWHLGQHFMGKSRQAEHRALIDWLLVQVDEHAVDAVLVVGDIFEQQDKNVDGSGFGDKRMFMQGLTTYGLSESDLFLVHTGSTDEIPFDWSSSAGFTPFRMFSVDAGHTAALTFNDLEIAFCNLLKGGIVVLDDFFHGGGHIALELVAGIDRHRGAQAGCSTHALCGKRRGHRRAGTKLPADPAR